MDNIISDEKDKKANGEKTENPAPTEKPSEDKVDKSSEDKEDKSSHGKEDKNEKPAVTAEPKKALIMKFVNETEKGEEESEEGKGGQFQIILLTF